MELDTDVSYAFTFRDGTKERLFFTPRELVPDGYTQAQLEEIERMLAFYGFDLLPLDYNIH
jgi:hypothetical protein